MLQVTDAQRASYEDKGYLRLGPVLSPEDLADLQARIDDIMLGDATIDYDRLLMQLDSATGKYEDAGVQSLGFKGATRAYRKIQNLEFDDRFLEFVERPIFKDICAHVYGPETPIACFRAMFMNKPARHGTWLPWHQDRWSYLDRDPMITVWTALDPATEANGCVQVIEGSHKRGLLNPEHGSGFVTEKQAADQLRLHPVTLLEMAAGEAVLLHNHLLHASDTNGTDQSRRAFSVCYMDAETVARNGERFTKLF
jgi:phytanoyl-CoA hydroxylase